MEIVVSKSPEKDIHGELEQLNTMHLAAAEEIKGRRRRPQKSKKAEKLATAVETAKAKQKLENMC